MPTKDEKLYIVAMGLPARGKSTVVIRLKDTFIKNGITTRIFNNGNIRRKYRAMNTTIAEFYDPENKPAAELRKHFALANMKRAKDFLEGKGQVAVLDATNVSRERRELIEAYLTDHPILYIECINQDEDILHLSILEKIKLPEFAHFTPDDAAYEFRKRIEYYKMIYAPLHGERNYIRMDSLYNRILEEKLLDSIPLYSRIRDFLVTDVVKNLYLIRHTETYFNLEDRIGGNSLLTPQGISQAKALGRFFAKRKISYIFTSRKTRTISTAEPIADIQRACTIIPLGEFDEINGGCCDSMTYQEIKEKMPHVHSAREADKYHYVYPGGEGYVTMKKRVEMGIKKAFYLNRHADNIMIIGHRAVNRMILSHFLYRREEDVPYIYVPQDKFYHITATQDRKLFELQKFD
ncbi:MAG: histidine phosphatase family protein [Deltaproteobacteria bacterium]|nr:histidine phosphatase family protein [Deltaproteobacteria bacterium]